VRSGREMMVIQAPRRRVFSIWTTSIVSIGARHGTATWARVRVKFAPCRGVGSRSCSQRFRGRLWWFTLKSGTTDRTNANCEVRIRNTHWTRVRSPQSMSKFVDEVGSVWWYQQLSYVESRSIPVRGHFQDTSISLDQPPVSGSISSSGISHAS
jgi:hypothetical protein